MKQQKQSKLFSRKKNNKVKKNENLEKNSVQVVEQKETSQSNSSKIEEILNHPVLKRRLPPIEKKHTEANDEEKIQNEIENNFNLDEEINNNIENIENLNEKEDQIMKDSLEIEKEIENYKKIEESPSPKKDMDTVDNVEKKINIIIEKKIKNEIGTGTPFYCENIQDLKNEVDNKSKIISKLSEEQNDYKFKLNELFEKLNKLLAENAELLLSEETEEENQKQENLNELKLQLELRKKGINSSKNQNKIYKQQYDLLTNKEKNTKYENVEKKIDKLKLENNELLKQIKNLKSQSRKDGKKLEDYSYNGKYLSDINKITNELKTLENKKHEYFKKLANNNKFINNCIKEFENLENFYNLQKNTKNYFNAKIEEEINRLREDLSGSEEEIIKRIETDSAFIIKKLIHNEKINNNIFKTPIPNKPADVKKMKLKKGNSLEPLAKIKLARNNIHSGQSRRMNIVAKNKSPLLTNNNGTGTNNKEQDDFDPSKINYNDLTEYEYKEMISKKEHYYDVVAKLEKSIKEAQKMYQRKLKEMKVTVEENSQKLNAKNKENESLKSEIDDLNKIYALTEQENKIMNGQNTKMKKTKKKTNTNNNDINNNNNEKELESHKEYLSPEYYNNQENNSNTNNNKIIGKDKDRDKLLIQTHSNTDMTRNEILNDLKVLNGEGQDSSIEHKNSNFNMKFPDLSNIEENINVNINPKNEFERNKAIDDIKKKYNIKSGFDDNDNNDDLNDDLNLEEDNDEEKMLKEQERLKKEEIEERQRIEKEIEDEKKFFKEHEKILNNEEDEGQFEPPIQNNIMDNTNNNNINKEEEHDNNNNDNNNNNEIYIINQENNDNNLENIEKGKDNENNFENNNLEKEELKQENENKNEIENDNQENNNLDENNNNNNNEENEEKDIKNNNDVNNDNNNDSLEQLPNDNQEKDEEGKEKEDNIEEGEGIENENKDNEEDNKNEENVEYKEQTDENEEHKDENEEKEDNDNNGEENLEEDQNNQNEENENEDENVNEENDNKNLEKDSIDNEQNHEIDNQQELNNNDNNDEGGNDDNIEDNNNNNDSIENKKEQ